MLTEIIIFTVSLSLPLMASANEGYEGLLGRIDFDREQFAKALEGRHKSYDPIEKMISRPYSSAGYHYHTGYRGNVVHPTRDSLNYAVLCLDSGMPELFQRGIEILEKVISLQDTDENSRTYGIWSWYLEEPLDKMDAPDFNWADFCGVQLLQSVLRHGEQFPDDLAQRVRKAILNAAHSIRKRNVGPGYTNIAIMGTYVTLLAGQLYDDETLLDYGKKRLDRFYQYTLHHGCFTEFNSPTYNRVALGELGRILRDVKDEDCLKKTAALYRLAWAHIGRHFHEPTRQWAGPHSRAYRDLESRGFWHFIQRATNNQIQFVPTAELPFDIDDALLPLRCPQDCVKYFRPLDEPRQEIEVFFKGKEPLPEAKSDEVGDLPLVGTTFIHRIFALGTVNRCDFWNQRRPLILHCGSYDKPSYMRLRFLHDDYDYSSAMFFCVQWQDRALVGVNFATDYGDKHLSLHRVKGATIQAEDLRLRLELGGNLSSLQLPQDWGLSKPACIYIGDLRIQMKVTFAEFGGFPIEYEVGREESKAWVDVVIHHGQKRSINFSELDCAALGIALEVSESDVEHAASLFNEGDSFRELDASLENGRLVQKWNEVEHAASLFNEGKRLVLRIPVKPSKVGQLQRQPVALIDKRPPWDFAQPSLKHF